MGSDPETAVTIGFTGLDVLSPEFYFNTDKYNSMVKTIYTDGLYQARDSYIIAQKDIVGQKEELARKIENAKFSYGRLVDRFGDNDNPELIALAKNISSMEEEISQCDEVFKMNETGFVNTHVNRYSDIWDIYEKMFNDMKIKFGYKVYLFCENIVLSNKDERERFKIIECIP